MVELLKNSIALLNIFRFWPHCLFYVLFKNKVIEDIRVNDKSSRMELLKFLRLLTFCKPFRNVFYYRIGGGYLY